MAISDKEFGELLGTVKAISKTVDKIELDGSEGRQKIWDALNENTKEISALRGKATIAGAIGGTVLGALVIAIKQYFGKG